MQDVQGNRLSGATAAGAAALDAAVRAFNLYRGDPLAELDRAAAAAPTMPMVPITRAWLLAMAVEPAAAVEARGIVAGVRAMPMDERERSHLAALDHVLAGEWDTAALALDNHTMRWPRDLLALQVGHLIDFFRANARDLSDRITRALPFWAEDVPGRSVVLGMLAFGLEETGDYARAEAAGRAAVAAEPLDCWAHHAVAHVMEMQGRAEDGIGWMAAREPYWTGDGNFFQVHNWWHKALCHLDLSQADAVLALYDGPVRGGRSQVAIDLVDAAALLWRMALTGVDPGARWAELSIAWEAHADGRLYPFNDWHAIMAHLGAGRDATADRLLTAMRATAAGEGQIAAWTRTTGLPLALGFTAFWRGRDAEAAAQLHAARFIANRFGGSHAQRDVIDWTLAEAALRAGDRTMAESLAHERLAIKPHSPVNRAFLRRARALGTANVPAPVAA